MRRAPTPSQRCRRALFACAIGSLLLSNSLIAQTTEKAIALGDSLTAEYLVLDGLSAIPGFEQPPTRYAEVTKFDGRGRPLWVSKSWTEVLAQCRGFYFDFGRQRKNWGLPRLGGFERNWGIPGAKASDYDDFFTSTFESSPLFFGFRAPLDVQLRAATTKRVVIWLGTNDLNDKYGDLYDITTRDATATALKTQLIDNLTDIIDRVQELNDEVQIVVGNLPDLGATPAIIYDPLYADETVRAAVSTEIEEINAAIADLAEEKEIGLADVYAITENLIDEEPFVFGAIEFKWLPLQEEAEEPEMEAEVAGVEGGEEPEEPVEFPTVQDNDPHFLFTKDYFHPNTALQIQVARTFIKAFNDTYKTRIPQITHAEALKICRINPREPYFNWISTPGVDRGVPDVAERGLLKDPDTDRMTNLMEYAFDKDPTVAQSDDDPDKPLPFWISGPVEGINSEYSVVYELPEEGRRRDIDIAVQYKIGRRWIRVPPDRIVEDDVEVQVAIPRTAVGVEVPLRIKVSLLPPQGALNTVSTVYKFDDTVTPMTP